MIQSGLIAFDVICKINNIPVDLRAIVRENGITNEEISVEELEREMKPYEGFLKDKFDVQFSRVKYFYPWNRFFEIEADLL